jgi:ABC-type phosphate transport system substrate-binding protein
MKAINPTGTCILFLGLALASAAARAQEVVVVANEGVPISHISSAELRDMFNGVHSGFGNGARIVPVLLKGGPAHEVFLSHLIGESSDQFRTRWRKATFTGQGSMPKEFSSEAALLEYVAATPGAIGYVSALPGDKYVKVLIVSKSTR